MIAFRRCVRCVMDTSAEEITFDENGVCSFCRTVERDVLPILERAAADEGRGLLAAVAGKIKRSGAGKPYDSLLGLSGGADSSYLACLAVELGLRPLFVHVDTGWNTPQSEQNVHRLVEALGCDFRVLAVDPTEMRDVQLAFYKASVPNCDIPQDHVFLALLYKTASELGIEYILSGGNFATESILPASWGYDAGDVRHLKAIHKRYGTLRLRRFPTLGIWHRYVYYPFVRNIREVRLLNYLDYNKASAVQELQVRFGWQEYGAKHYETVQTRFFQGYYLPTKFGIDKRKAHLSSLICSGQMTREAALRELRTNPYPSEDLLRSDMALMAERLGVTASEWQQILALPPRRHDEFPSQKRLFQAKDVVVRMLGLRRRQYTA